MINNDTGVTACPGGVTHERGMNAREAFWAELDWLVNFLTGFYWAKVQRVILQLSPVY